MRTISGKLTIAFLLVSIIAAALVAVVIRLTSPERLNALLRDQARSQLVTLLASYYSANGSFNDIATVLNANGYLPQPLPKNPPGQPPIMGSPNGRLVFALTDVHGKVILTMLPNFPMGAILSSGQLAAGNSIEVNGQVVGTIITPPASITLTPEEQTYLDRTSQALWLAAIGAIAVALVTGVLLARSIARPLRALTSAAQRMAGGELEQEVPVSSKDEIGQLTQAFNSMSQTVSKANQLRRQMTADIAHDLRTPLTVIAGYVESMQEGVLAPTPDRLDIIHSEIERLQRMVEDLRTLSRADAGELTLVRQPIDLRFLLERMMAVYHHAGKQKKVEIRTEISGDLPTISVDETRMTQVVSNLLDNALRYTPAGGTITLGALKSKNGIDLFIQDTGQGILPEDLPHVFERFYRADKSRSEDNGATGLGLAIAKALVIAHGGEIHAESAPGKGTKIIISIPG